MALFNRFYDRFPNTDFSQINLDWIIEKLAKHEIQIQELFSQDIPTEVQNVMNEWLDDGTIADLINDDLLNSIFLSLQGDISALDTKLTNSKTWKVETFADIELITELAAGDTVTTAGFYTAGDGGGSVYIIGTSSSGLAVGGTGFYAWPMSVKARTWGLIGDGSDETAALQLAINGSLNRELDLDNLTITISGNVSLRHKFHFHGNGAGLTVANSTTMNYMINAGGLHDVKIEGIRFDRGTQTDNFYAINMSTGYDNVIRDCYFTGGLGYCIRISGCNNIFIENCDIYDITGVVGDPGGFVYMQGGHDVNIKSIRAANLQDHVVYLDGSVETWNVFVEKIFANNLGVSALTNAAVVAVYGNVHDLVIRDVVGRSLKTGLNFSYRSGMPSKFVVDCCDLETDEVNVFVSAGAGNIGAVVHGVVRNCRLSSENEAAIDIRFVNWMHIQNNVIRKAGTNGIAFTGSQYDSIVGNIISGCTTGIYLGARDVEEGVTSADFWTANNVVRVNNSYGITEQTTVSRFFNYCNIITGSNSDPTKNLTTGGSAYNIATPGPGQGNTVRSIEWGTAAPTVGRHLAGDICFNITGATLGWHCTAAGTPGTWAAII